MNKIIKLNENDIRAMVSESVRQILDINGRRRLYESQLKECVSPDEDVDASVPQSRVYLPALLGLGAAGQQGDADR